MNGQLNSAPYKELFPVGTKVRIKSEEFLAAFKHDWKWHHPVSDEQLAHADKVDEVRTVGFYHGGDVIYTLRNAPGTWHEQCLEEV